MPDQIAGYMIIGPDSGGKMQADWDGEVHRDLDDARGSLAHCHSCGHTEYELFEMRRVPAALVPAPGDEETTR